jgi:hypothetical protein
MPYARSGSAGAKSWRSKRPSRDDLPNERGNGYDHNAPKPTIGSCHPHEITTLLIYCSNYAAFCYHQGTLRVADFPDDMLFEQIGRRCRCTKCGQKGAQVRPDWSDSWAFKPRR